MKQLEYAASTQIYRAFERERAQPLKLLGRQLVLGPEVQVFRLDGFLGKGVFGCRWAIIGWGCFTVPSHCLLEST